MSEKSRSIVKKAKVNCLKLVKQANSSHIGGAFSIADVLAVLYADVLTFDTNDILSKNRDRIFYSKGHACSILYTILAEVGFIDQEELFTFSQNGSYLTTHINHNIPGIELSTGSLGHAMSVACGVAYAGKIGQQHWKTYCIVSDGELDEGSNWEAIMFAAHHQLKNFVLIVDYNKIQSFGNVKDVINLEPLKAKFEAFNFNVCDIDGHDHDAVFSSLSETFHNNKPVVIIANTIKGKGVDFMEHELKWHYKSPNEIELALAINQIEEA